MQDIWKSHHLEEQWGFLLIDAKNAFNEQNRMLMLWTVRHEWPTGARFAFNCYRHWSVLYIRDADGSASTIYSKEGVTQGDPLAMFLYGLGVLPIIRELNDEFDFSTKQVWYADDSAVAGKFRNIAEFFKKIQD